ncbi:C-type lectin (CTL) or carbohydrate-recognition domain (CRD) [Mactra antiquata]
MKNCLSLCFVLALLNAGYQVYSLCDEGISPNGPGVPDGSDGYTYKCAEEFISYIPGFESKIFHCKGDLKWNAQDVKTNTVYLDDVTCQMKVECPSLPDFPNTEAEVISSFQHLKMNKSAYYDGERIKYKCSQGSEEYQYDFHEANNESQLAINEIECMSSGLWNDLDLKAINFIKCSDVICPELKAIDNGYISHSYYGGEGNKIGTVAKYTCREGYRIFGNADEYIRVCEIDGKWNGTAPYCKVPHCDEIPTYNGGTVKYHGNRRRNTKVVLRNDDKFRMDTFCYLKKDKRVQCSPKIQCIHLFKNRKDSHNTSHTSSSSIEIGVCKLHLPYLSSSFVLILEKLVIDIPDNCETSTTNKELLHEESYRLSAKHGYEFKQNNQYLDISRNIIQITNNNGTLEPTPPQCKPETYGYVKCVSSLSVVRDT